MWHVFYKSSLVCCGPFLQVFNKLLSSLAASTQNLINMLSNSASCIQTTEISLSSQSAGSNDYTICHFTKSLNLNRPPTYLYSLLHKYIIGFESFIGQSFMELSKGCFLMSNDVWDWIFLKPQIFECILNKFKSQFSVLVCLRVKEYWSPTYDFTALILSRSFVIKLHTYCILYVIKLGTTSMLLVVTLWNLTDNSTTPSPLEASCFRFLEVNMLSVACNLHGKILSIDYCSSWVEQVISSIDSISMMPFRTLCSSPHYYICLV